MNSGNPDFSPGAIANKSIKFCPTDSVLYIAYRDEINAYKASVKKFDGTSWQSVGNADFSVAGAGVLSFAFNSSGRPYVSYQDNGYSGKASVMKYNGNGWVAVGNTGFSAGEAD